MLINERTNELVSWMIDVIENSAMLRNRFEITNVIKDMVVVLS